MSRPKINTEVNSLNDCRRAFRDLTLNVESLSDDPLTVRVDGTSIGTGNQVNFISGSGITVTGADDTATPEIDVTIASTFEQRQDRREIAENTIAYTPAAELSWSSSSVTDGRCYAGVVGLYEGDVITAIDFVGDGDGGGQADNDFWLIITDDAFEVVARSEVMDMLTDLPNGPEWTSVAISYTVPATGRYYLGIGNRGASGAVPSYGNASATKFTYTGDHVRSGYWAQTSRPAIGAALGTPTLSSQSPALFARGVSGYE